MIRHRAGRRDQRAALNRHPRRLAPPGRCRPARSEGAPAGFTIIELLVVLAIIAAVVGGVGLALRGGDGTVALGSAQRTMSSLLTSTRAQAIMNGTNARLIVHVDWQRDAEKYLRFTGIVREEVQSDGTSYSPRRWVPTSEGTYLPRGTYFVPPFDEPSPANDLFSDDWDRDSDAFSRFPDPGNPMELQYPETIPDEDHVVEGRAAGGTVEQWAYYEFAPNGELTGGAGMQIVLTTGSETPTTPVLENPDNVRGLILRRIGAFHLVDERLTFHGTE